MRRTLLTAGALTLLMISPAAAQQRQFYDAAGRDAGRATTDTQGTTTFYDSAGQVTGRAATDSQGSTTFYDETGRVTGRATGAAASKSGE